MGLVIDGVSRGLEHEPSSPFLWLLSPATYRAKYVYKCSETFALTAKL